MHNLQGPPPLAIDEPLSESELCPDDLLRGQEEAFARDVARLRARSAGFVRCDCPACDGTDVEPIFEKEGFAYVRCGSCRTIYMDPRPSPDIMADYYASSENYRYWASFIFPASEDARRRKIHEPWFARVVDYCTRFGIEKGMLVDVGGGFGTFAEVAVADGSFERVVVVEPTPELAAACRERGLEVIETRVEDVAGRVSGADVVVSFETIEHLFSPREFLHQVKKMIKPGGLLVVSCPNGEGFDIATLGAVSLAVDPEHVNLFNPSSLSLLLEKEGFKPLEVTTPGRLDAEFVRTAVLEGRHSLDGQPLLERILITEWDRLGQPFQNFLAANGLSSHMWATARAR
jgi:2-polyprenyl-3-methyl-5-hydroxy-6-metoxy-1,4-benzoquinol methylase/ribosomal protein S27E